MIKTILGWGEFQNGSAWKFLSFWKFLKFFTWYNYNWWFVRGEGGLCGLCLSVVWRVSGGVVFVFRFCAWLVGVFACFFFCCDLFQKVLLKTLTSLSTHIIIITIIFIIIIRRGKKFQSEVVRESLTSWKSKKVLILIIFVIVISNCNYAIIVEVLPEFKTYKTL